MKDNNFLIIVKCISVDIKLKKNSAQCHSNNMISFLQQMSQNNHRKRHIQFDIIVISTFKQQEL